MDLKVTRRLVEIKIYWTDKGKANELEESDSPPVTNSVPADGYHGWDYLAEIDAEEQD